MGGTDLGDVLALGEVVGEGIDPRLTQLVQLRPPVGEHT
jgi:hypothetical protein